MNRIILQQKRRNKIYSIDIVTSPDDSTDKFSSIDGAKKSHKASSSSSSQLSLLNAASLSSNRLEEDSKAHHMSHHQLPKTVYDPDDVSIVLFESKVKRLDIIHSMLSSPPGNHHPIAMSSAYSEKHLGLPVKRLVFDANDHRVLAGNESPNSNIDSLPITSPHPFIVSKPCIPKKIEDGGSSSVSVEGSGLIDLPIPQPSYGCNSSINDPAMSKLLQAISSPMPIETTLQHERRKELHLIKQMKVDPVDREAFKVKLDQILSSPSTSASLQAKRLNNALLFLKPHAATIATQYLVTSTLEQYHVRVVSHGTYSGQDLAAQHGLFHRHFGYMGQYETKHHDSSAMASDRLDLKPAEQDLFVKTFSEEWGSVLRSGRVMTLSAAASLLQPYRQLSEDQLYGIWDSREHLQLKLRRGLYICPFDSSETLLMGILDEPIYVINGFWSSMEKLYLHESACVMYMFIEWDANHCSWMDMIRKVVGDGRPSHAVEGSIRRSLMDNWRALGLVAAPNRRDNGVYISKSALEAVVDRLHWVKGAMLFTDSFSSKLMACNIPSLTINLWLKNNPVISGKHLFDHMFGLDSDACLALANELFGMHCTVYAVILLLRCTVL